MKKRIYNLRWHLTKKRWHKQWGEYRYNLKQNIRGFKKKLRIFFTPQRRGQMRRKKTPAIGLLLVILSSGTLIGIWHYTPNVWRTYKSWKAFNDAKKYWSKGNAEHAFWSAQVSSYNSGGRNKYDNLAILAKASRAINHYSVLEFQEKLALNTKSSTQEYLVLVKLALDRKDFSRAEKYFPMVAHLASTKPEVELLRLRILTRNWRSNQEEALNIARSLIKNKELKSTELDRIYIDLCLRDSSVYQEGLRHILKLIHRRDESGLVALRRLMQLDTGLHISQTEKNQFFPLYLKHPLANREDKLAAFSYGFQSGLVQHSELDLFIQENFPVQMPESLEKSQIDELLKWLNGIGLPHKFLLYVPLDVVQKNKFTYVDYLQVMMSSGQAGKVVKLLEGNDFVFSRAERFLLLSIALNRKGSKRYAVSNYELGLAHANPTDLPMIDYIFARIEHTERLTETLRKWSNSSEFSNIAKALLLKIYYEQNQEDALESLLEEMDTKHYLNSPRHLTDLIHMKVLHDRDPEKCLNLIEELCSTQPIRPKRLLILGLAYYINNKPEKALRALEECQIDFLYESPSNQAIAGIILDANNRRNDSRHFLKDIDPTRLTPPERQLLSQISTPFLYKNSPLFQEIIQN